MSSYDLSPLDGPDGARIVFGGAAVAELDPAWWRYNYIVYNECTVRGDIVAALILPGGEVREQTVLCPGYRLPRGWRGTALRRWGKLDPDCVTPQVLIKMVPA